MFRLARPRNGARCPRRWYRRTEKTRRLRADSRPNGTKWSLPAKQAGEHSRKGPEYLKKLGVLNLHLSNDINTLHAGGAGSLERTRLRFQPKITCYCGFLMHLGPYWPRSCRFFVMIQRFNSFAGAIGNTWKTRQKHDDNRPAAGPKQADSTMANTAGTACCRSRKPESVAFLELSCGWPQSEGA